MSRIYASILIATISLIACGKVQSQVTLDSDDNCLFDAIHPSGLDTDKTVFFYESSNGSNWNSRLVYKDYYANVNSTICNLIALNVVFHRYEDLIDLEYLEKFNYDLKQISKSTPFYTNLPSLNYNEKLELLNTNSLEKDGLMLSIIETDVNSILIVSWTSNTP